MNIQTYRLFRHPEGRIARLHRPAQTRFVAILRKWSDKFGLGALSGRSAKTAAMEEPMLPDFAGARVTVIGRENSAQLRVLAENQVAAKQPPASLDPTAALPPSHRRLLDQRREALVAG